jgi:hypothetical protein
MKMERTTSCLPRFVSLVCRSDPLDLTRLFSQVRKLLEQIKALRTDLINMECLKTPRSEQEQLLQMMQQVIIEKKYTQLLNPIFDQFLVLIVLIAFQSSVGKIPHSNSS